MNSFIYKLTSVLLVTSLLISVTACYRMPTSEDYSVIPMTNNPDMQRSDANQTFVPSNDF